jgi:hypothetical protein
MMEDPRDDEYLDLFKPKSGASTGDPSGGPDDADLSSSEAEEQVDEGDFWDAPVTESRPQRPAGEVDGTAQEVPSRRIDEPTIGPAFDRFFSEPRDPEQTLRTVGAIVGGGCLLLMLIAVVIFAFVQVFGRRGGEEDGAATATPTTVAATSLSPAATSSAGASPLFVPLVNSSDVRVPLALPERLLIGETAFEVMAVTAPSGTWPPAPSSAGVANWVYGTVVNYILGLAPAQGNRALVFGLEIGDVISLQMSTGLVLNFNVNEVVAGLADETGLFEQVSPRLTLALLAQDPAQRITVKAAFSGEQEGETTVFSEAAIGLVGTPVNQGPVRLTVIETYQVSAGEAGLPAGTGYLLLDASVENVGDAVLEPGLFQTFVSSQTNERYPLTMLAEQFAHYGIPTEPLAPGETVIGSFGYLLPAAVGDQVRWAFNPLPGSKNWILVPLPYDVPPFSPTTEPPPPVGFAQVSVDTKDVFIDRSDGLLDIGLRIQNVSEGVVQVTEQDISLSSWTDGELALIAPAPALPWVVEPGELKLCQLQFELPSADSALLDVLGYTFSIENLGGE